MFYWESPTGVIHIGELFQMQTSCGAKIGPIGSGWSAVAEQDATCPKCVKALGPRPTRVRVDMRGMLEYEYEGERRDDAFTE